MTQPTDPTTRSQLLADALIAYVQTGGDLHAVVVEKTGAVNLIIADPLIVTRLINRAQQHPH